jgi:restriction system protein
MKFSDINIYPVLQSSVPERFQDMNHFDFEDFIAELFEKKGFQVEQTSYSGDYGADLIVKSEYSYAVQVKRYNQKNKVGVKDVNQILGAKAYYGCDKAIMLTTSFFSAAAIKLCEKTDVEMWDWEKLLQEINLTYFNGKDYYTFFEDEILLDKKQDVVFNLSFELSEVQYRTEIKKFNGLYTNVFFRVTNNNSKNLNVIMGKPIYISNSGYQTDPDCWYEDEFSAGIIYAGSTVEIGFAFQNSKVPKLSIGDKFILEVLDEYGSSVQTEYYKITDKDHDLCSSSQCFVVTMCYGRNTTHYREMIFFRDYFLINWVVGRKFISWYYEYGRYFVNRYKDSTFVRLLSKAALFPIVKTVPYINNFKR